MYDHEKGPRKGRKRKKGKKGKKDGPPRKEARKEGQLDKLKAERDTAERRLGAEQEGLDARLAERDALVIVGDPVPPALDQRIEAHRLQIRLLQTQLATVRSRIAALEDELILLKGPDALIARLEADLEAEPDNFDLEDRIERVRAGGQAALEFELRFDRNARRIAEIEDQLEQPEIEERDDLVDRLENTQARLEEENGWLEERIEAVMGNSDNPASPKKVGKLEKKMTKVEGQRAGYESDLSEVAAERAALDTQIEDLEDKENPPDGRIERLEKKGDLLDVDAETLESRVDAADDRIFAIMARIVAVEGSGAVEPLILKLEEQIGKLQQRKATLEGRMGRVDVRSDYAKGDGDGLDNRSSKLQDRIDATDDAITDLETEIVELEEAA